MHVTTNLDAARASGERVTQQQRLRYRAAIARLGDVERHVFELHCARGRSIADIATEMNISTEEGECRFAAALLGVARALEDGAD